MTESEKENKIKELEELKKTISTRQLEAFKHEIKYKKTCEICDDCGQCDVCLAEEIKEYQLLSGKSNGVVSGCANCRM